MSDTRTRRGASMDRLYCRLIHGPTVCDLQNVFAEKSIIPLKSIVQITSAPPATTSALPAISGEV